MKRDESWRDAPRRPRISINLVDPGIPPEEAPLSERINKEATLAARKYVADRLGRTPRGVSSLLHQVGETEASNIVQPDDDLVRRVMARHEQMKLETCGTCSHFSREELHRWLDGGGYQAIAEYYGAEAIGWLGNLSQYGLCLEKDRYFKKFTDPATGCDFYVPRSKGAFGRMVGGIWRRVQSSL